MDTPATPVHDLTDIKGSVEPAFAAVPKQCHQTSVKCRTNMATHSLSATYKTRLLQATGLKRSISNLVQDLGQAHWVHARLYDQRNTPNCHCVCRSFSYQPCDTSKPLAMLQRRLVACWHSHSLSAWPTSQMQLYSCCNSFNKPAQMWLHSAGVSNAMLSCVCSRAPEGYPVLSWQCSLVLN